MKKINISQVDTVFANGSYPIEMLFYYQEKLRTTSIRNALKKLSLAFWPVFGKYNDGMIHFDRYKEEDCFTELNFHRNFNRTDTDENMFENHRLINPPILKRLFYLTVVQYYNGTVLIPRMNHLAGDGYSYFYFLSVLSALSRKSLIPFRKRIIRLLTKPDHHRTVLKDFRFSAGELPPAPQIEKITLEFFKIHRQEVRTWIKQIGPEFDQSVSPNDILCALALKKMVLSHKKDGGNTFQLTIPMDVRREIKEYGTKYFGNGLMFNTINFNTKTIENSSAGFLAAEIRKAMPGLSRESYLTYLKEIEIQITKKQFQNLRPYDPEQGCLITNLSRMPANKLDFGTGLPDLIFPLTVEKNSAAILADQENYTLRFAY